MFKIGSSVTRLSRSLGFNFGLKSKRRFTSLVPAFPREPMPLAYTKMRNGMLIPKPVGAAVERLPHEIIGYGKDAVIPYTGKYETEFDVLYEQARLGYLELRDSLMLYCEGYWVAVSSAGDALFIGTDQCELMDYVDEVAQQHTDERRVFYVNCVGREILSELKFEESQDGTDDTRVDFTRLYEEMMPSDTNSIEYDQQILFIGEFSHDNENYKSLLMKHDSGAHGVTAPSEYFEDVKSAGATVRIKGRTGVKDARTISNKYFRINGLVTKVKEICEHDKFLVGYPIWSRYENVINTSKTEVLTMTPLDGQRNHI